MAGHAGRKFRHAVGGNGHVHHQCIGILDGSHGAAADRTNGSIQRRDGAIHRGSQGAVLQGAAQCFQIVRGTLGLLQLGSAVLHILGFVQQVGVVLLLVVAVVGCFDLLLAGTDLGIGSVDSVLSGVQGGFRLILGAVGVFQGVRNIVETVQAQRGSRAAVLGIRQGSLCALVGFLRGLQVVVGGVHCVLVGVAGVSVVSRNGAVYSGDSLILGIGSGVQRGGVGADAG